MYTFIEKMMGNITINLHLNKDIAAVSRIGSANGSCDSGANTFGYSSGLVKVPLMILALLSILFLGSLNAQAANTYYVRAGATGANSGVDWNNAYNSFSAAGLNGSSSTSPRGNTYYVADGSYGGITFKNSTSGSTVITIKKATASDHGSGTGWSSDYGDGQAIFTSLNVSTSYWIIDGNNTSGYGFLINFGGVSGQASNITSGASHLDFKSIKYDGQVPNHARGMRFYNGGSDVLIQNVELTNCGNDAIMIHTYNDVTMDKIYIHDRNTDDSTHADAFELYGKSGAAYTIKNSRVDWNGQQIFFSGVVSQHGTWYIYGNRFYNTDNSPAASCKGIHPHSSNPTVTVYVYNNTFEGLYLAHDLGSNSSGVVKNNIYYNLTAGISGFGSARHDYNYFQKSLGGSGESHAQLGGDPFVKVESNNYRLSFSTNAGDSSIGAAYNKDPAGITRGGDGTWDRGAFEFSNGSTPNVETPSAPSNLRVIEAN